ncbi:MAG: fatty acid metabolism transcriptional regulator FadR [Candidatus Promineifilaceae bacterium]
MPKPDVSEERTAQIIEAAVTAFSRLGFDRTRMDDIAQEAGVSKGTLYLYFNSKDEIITAVLDQFLNEEMADFAAHLADPGPVSEKLRGIILQMMADTEAMMSRYLSVWLEFYAVASREGLLRTKMQQFMQQFVTLFAALLQEGVDKGEFRPVVVHDVALVMMAQLEGFLLLWAVDPAAVNLMVATETAVDLMLYGLKQT